MLGGVTPGVTTLPVAAGGGLTGGGLIGGGIDGGVTCSALVEPVPGLPRVGPAGRLPKVGPAAGELRNWAFAGPAAAIKAAIRMVRLIKDLHEEPPFDKDLHRIDFIQVRQTGHGPADGKEPVRTPFHASQRGIVVFRTFNEGEEVVKPSGKTETRQWTIDPKDGQRAPGQ